MNLHEVNSGIHKNKKRRRIGRGTGSGYGKTASRGHKGAGSRAGWSTHPAFQGGSMPLVRRVPKRGFNNKFAKHVIVLNVEDLELWCQIGDEVTPESLRKTPLLNGRFDELKILGNGEINKKLTVSAHRFSESAIAKIEKAGGKVVKIPGIVPVEEKKKVARAKNVAERKARDAAAAAKSKKKK